jgi:hypothetical protein
VRSSSDVRSPGMRNRALALGVTLALMAGCGGKTDESGGSGGESGVATNIGGAGGSSGGFGGGYGGSGAGGGSPGGSAGVAGGPIASLIEEVCAEIGALPCAPENCEGKLYDSWGDAFSQGCEKQFHAALDCVAKQPFQCAGEHLSPNPKCATVIDALETCMDVPSACGGGGVNGTCSFACDGWGASCNEHMGSVSCQCTFGPSAGQWFELPGACTAIALEQVEAWCG